MKRCRNSRSPGSKCGGGGFGTGDLPPPQRWWVRDAPPALRGRAIHGHGLLGIPTFPREWGHPPNPECSRRASRLPPELWGRSGWLFTCSPGARPHTHVHTRAPALAHAPDAAFDFPLSAASPRRLHSSSPAAPRLQVPLSPTSGCQQYQYSQISPALLQQRAPGAAERAAQPHSGRWHEAAAVAQASRQAWASWAGTSVAKTPLGSALSRRGEQLPRRHALERGSGSRLRIFWSKGILAAAPTTQRGPRSPPSPEVYRSPQDRDTFLW